MLLLCVLTVRWSIAAVPIGMCPGMAQGVALQLLMLTVSRFIAIDVTTVLTVRRSVAVVSILMCPGVTGSIAL
jgi:hypothetical protein